MQLSYAGHDPNARLAHKMNGHVFHVDLEMGQKNIRGTAMVHVTPEENDSGYRLMLRIRGEVDSIVRSHKPEPRYQYVLTEISGRVTDIHSIDNDTCGILFWTDAIRIITGENVHESMGSMSVPSIVSLFLEMDEAMRECLMLIRQLKGQISAYDGKPDFQWLQVHRIEQLEQLISQYHSLRAEQEKIFLDGCGNGEKDVLFF